MAENTTPPAKAAPANGQVRASSDAHTSKADQAEDALAQVEKEMFPTDADSVISQVDRETLRPEYTILDVDPNDLVLCQASKRDDVLLSAVAASLDAMGIIIPPMAVRLPDKNLQVLLGQGRTRVCWAQDRGVSQIRVVEIQLNGVPLWMIMREVAIEDLRRDLSYMRFIGWCDELEVHMKTIHSRQGARRKLIADQRRSQTMLAKKSGLPTDRHKVDANRSERWQDRKFGDPIQESKNDDTLATSMRFKYPLTVSLFFRRAMSESTARRVLKFREALRSEEPTICNYDMNKRLSGLAEGEYSADGIERKLRSLERVEQVKKKIREHSALTAKDIEVVIRWMFARIKCQNLWIWDAVNPCFGILRRLAQLQDHTRKQFGLTDEEAKSFVRGEYPGADVPLNLMAYLTRPGDLVVDFFAGSGAARDAAEHFLDPFWPDGTGRSVWWNSWSEAFRSDPKSRALRESIFPRDYWEVSHHRKCLQFDLEPNALARTEYGNDFVIANDVGNGVSDHIVQLVHQAAPQGARLVYLDPPYLSQADYAPAEGERCEDPPRSLQADLPRLRVARWAREEEALRRARAKVASKAAENHLSRMNVPRYVEVLARLIIDCQKIIAPNGRIALFMGLDAREGTLFDPGREIFKAVQDSFERLDQVPFELDHEGPLHHQVWVPSQGYGRALQIARKRSIGRLANVHRYVWILRRRDKGSCERLV